MIEDLKERKKVGKNNKEREKEWLAVKYKNTRNYNNVFQG